MAISLSKGGNVSLTKQAPGLTAVQVGLGWDVRVTDGAAFDLDASAFLLGAGGKVRSDADFVFYNNPKSVEGSVVHQGDNLTGVGDGAMLGQNDITVAKVEAQAAAVASPNAPPDAKEMLKMTQGMGDPKNRKKDEKKVRTSDLPEKYETRAATPLKETVSETNNTIAIELVD